MLAVLGETRGGGRVWDVEFGGTVCVLVADCQRPQSRARLKPETMTVTFEEFSRTHDFLDYTREKVGEYLKNNPNTTRADIMAKVKAHRDEIRQRVVKFLTPEQLNKWDSEVAKAKEFLGQKVDA